jgi:rod shape-determining protein MreD
MKWLWTIAWTYLVFVLHSGLAREAAVGGCAPHLVLAGLVLMVLRITGREAIALAAVWGFLSDCLVEGRLGVDVMFFVLTTMALRQLNARWNLRSPWRAAVVSMTFVWGELVASGSFRILAEGQTPDLPPLAHSAAGSAVYSGLLVAMLALAARLVARDAIDDDASAAPAVSNKWRMLTD